MENKKAAPACETGAEWVIERLNGEHYLLRVGGSFYTSAGCVRALLDEVEHINQH